MVSTSRKNPKTRKGELLQYIKKDIIELVNRHAGEMMGSTSGAKVLAEVAGTWGDCDDMIVEGIEGEVRRSKLPYFALYTISQPT